MTNNQSPVAFCWQHGEDIYPGMTCGCYLINWQMPPRDLAAAATRLNNFIGYVVISSEEVLIPVPNGGHIGYEL